MRLTLEGLNRIFNSNLTAIYRRGCVAGYNLQHSHDYRQACLWALAGAILNIFIWRTTMCGLVHGLKI